ncbi:RNA-directed DNA polymerase, eukaryota [Tanacetum coccineum]
MLAVASSGIASLLLPAGRTAHNRFVIPLDLMENSTCGIKQNTQLAELMQKVQLIIWDEAPMTQRYAFEALDITLRDILGFKDSERRQQIFGGMNVSELWRYCKFFTLTRSMRVNEYSPNGEIDTSKQEFNQWVLAVDNGTLPSKVKEGEDEPTCIDILEKFLIKTWDCPIRKIMEETYPDFTSRRTNDEYLKERAILTPRNEDTYAINEYMFKKLPGEVVTYNSAAEICKASTDNIDQHQLYLIEFLNSLNFPGFYGGSGGVTFRGLYVCRTQGQESKETKDKERVNFLSLQETKMESIELFDIKRCWGNFAFDYVHSASVGNSGGILSVWDSNSFMKINVTISDYFVMVRGEVILMGDFNEVRNKNERFGSVLNLQGANAFNSFISSAGLEKVPLGGYSFTWCHRSASKMSKLDRFLISKNLMNSCLNFLAITLDRYLFDHFPILLRESKYNYGPIPFHFFHYWFEVDGFKKLVNEAWLEVHVDASNAMLNLMYQLKYLKKKIRAWNGMRKSYKNSKFMLKMELADLEAIIDKGNASDDIITKRMEIEIPTLVKNEFLSQFKKRFEGPNLVRPILNMEFPRHLNSIQKADIEAEVSNEEIKRAIWDFGIDKSPRPDGFTFGFYRHFWKLIDKDVISAVKHFFQCGFIPKGVNSSFIALIPKSLDAKMVKEFCPISLIGSLYKIIAKILANRLVMVLGDIVNEVQSAFVADRQILDGPFNLNEIFQWCKSKKKHSFIFKVDFEKAYDSVRWDYLDDVLKSLALERDGVDGFKSAFGLLGVRVVDAGMFKGIALDSSMQLSHMFYADDAVFVGQWNNLNIDTIIHVLKCFHRVSGLCINMSKSKIIGIVVNEDRVKQAASKIRCEILKVPFSYLGSHESSLAYGIYSMSFFNGVDLGSKKSIWLKWNSVLASKEKGGLGVSSLYALNRAIMFKYVWRFTTQKTSLWAKVIKAIHGGDGKIGKHSKAGHASIWRDIVQEMDAFKHHGIDLYSFMQKKLGDGSNTFFWEDVWCENTVLKDKFPRLYALELNKNIKVAAKLA